MSSLNKLELNNLIVSMRHNVNRAKVQTINKLTKLIKELRNKKATDKLKLKNENKAEKLVNEVLVMKTIPRDEIAAFSLSNTRKVNEILGNVESSYRLKALARMSIHNSILPIVEQFRTQYPSWEKEFPQVLISLKKREKPSKNKLKPAKKLKDANNEISVQRLNDAEDSDMEDGLSDQQSDNEVIYTKGNRFSVSSDDIDISDNLMDLKEFNSNNTSSNFKKNKNGKFELAKTPKASKKSLIPDQSREDSGAIVKNDVINKPTIQNTKIQAKSNQPFKRNFDETSSNLKAKKVEDPFFLSNDDQPYKAIQPIYHNKVEMEESDDVSSPEEDDFEFVNSYKNKVKTPIKKMAHTNNKSQNDRSSSSVKHQNKFTKQFKHPPVAKNLKTRRNSEEKLHPSWEAKKKISSIADFQGKKIVFD